MLREISIVTMTACLVASSPARSQSNPEALEAFRQGTALFQFGEYIEAADSFRRAYDLQPSWKLWFNIGQCEAAAKRYGFAVEAFEAYLAEGGDDIPAERKTAVLGELEQLRPMTGLIEVTAPDGATIAVDGVIVGTAPLHRRIRLAAGTPHVLEVVQGNHAVLVREIQVGGAEVARIDAAPAPVAEAPAPRAPSPAPPTEAAPSPTGRSALGPWGGVLLGTGLALLVVGGVTGGLALAKDAHLVERCPGTTCDKSETGALDTRDSLATASTVCFIAGGVVAATGAALLIAKLTSSKKRERATGIAPMGLGASATWRF